MATVSSLDARETVQKRLHAAIQLKTLMDSEEADKNGSINLSPDDLFVTAIRSHNQIFNLKRKFQISPVRTDEAAARLAASLAEPARKEGWNVQEAILLAYDQNTQQSPDDTGAFRSQSGAVFEIKNNRSRPIGMFSCLRQVSVEDHDDEEAFLIQYAIQPQLAYVLPDNRGKLLASALRRAMMGSIIGDIQALAALWRTGVLHRIADVQLQFVLEWNGVSHVDDLFMDSLHQNLEEQVLNSFTTEEIEGFLSFEPVERW